MTFKSWLARLEGYQSLLSRHFRITRATDLGRLVVYSSDSPTGQKVNFTVEKGKPGQIKVGFTMDHADRDSYGPRSPKDVACNQNLMPGSLEMVRRLRDLSRDLQQAGILLTYDPIDSRRAQFFGKLFR